MDDGMDYDVQTTVNFRLDFDGSGEFNMLLLPDVQKQFVQHVKEVYDRIILWAAATSPAI